MAITQNVPTSLTNAFSPPKVPSTVVSGGSRDIPVVSGGSRDIPVASGGGTSNISPNPVDIIPIPSDSPIKVVIPPSDVATQTPRDIPVVPQVGTSNIASNPLDSIQKAIPTVVTTTTPTAVISGFLVDAYTSRPIVIPTPNVVSDGVKGLAGSFGGGGGGGGGGASSEEEGGDVEEGGVIQERKKPNYLLLALLAVGAYLAYKKLK